MRKYLILTLVLLPLLLFLTACGSSDSVKKCALTITVLGEGIVTPSQESYPIDTIAYIDVQPAANWLFSHWEGANRLEVISGGDKWQVLMDGNKKLVAVFVESRHTLDIEIIGNGKVEEELLTNEYDHSSIVRLQAKPNEGWVFKEWLGDKEGKSSTILIEMNSDKIITAFFEEDTGFYSLNVSVEGNGSITKSPDKEKYAKGEKVALNALADSDCLFVEWRGDATSNNPSLSIEMDSNKGITAVFAKKIKEYSLDVKILGHGQVIKLPNEEQYVEGTEVTLTALADSGWLFTEWRGDETGSDPSIIIRMDSDKSITAIFEKDTGYYSLDVKVKGNGKVIKSPDKEKYAKGEEVTLGAEADTDWYFVEWQGDLCGDEPTKSIKIVGETLVTAVFEEDTSNLNRLSIIIEGNGNVNLEPGGGMYIPGEDVVLTARADADWEFKEWGGDATGCDAEIMITMYSDKTVKAIFTPIQKPDKYSLNLFIYGQGTVTKDPDALWYDSGTVVTLTAKASDGYKFAGWSGGASGYDTTIKLTMDKSINLIADFILKEYAYIVKVSAGNQGGTPYRQPDKILYKPGESVELIGNPAAGYCVDYLTANGQKHVGHDRWKIENVNNDWEIIFYYKKSDDGGANIVE